FVQVNPSFADSVETLCSLNFANPLRGVEHGPEHKQVDPQELFKYKQMAEKQRQEEREIMKLQNNFQSLQLRFAALEQLFRSLQEKCKGSTMICEGVKKDIKAILTNAGVELDTRGRGYYFCHRQKQVLGQSIIATWLMVKRMIGVIVALQKSRTSDY
ncbi:hypothetical protein IFM89_004408, partial [Coptis chinensis]